MSERLSEENLTQLHNAQRVVIPPHKEKYVMVSDADWTELLTELTDARARLARVKDMAGAVEKLKAENDRMRAALQMVDDLYDYKPEYPRLTGDVVRAVHAALAIATPNPEGNPQ